MTERENEIVQLIKENPLISQNELAQKLGITRSSVAVHVSNLTKKGFIIGRSYILQPTSGIAVVGGANIDIYGAPFKKPVLNDSNPGKVQYSLGGVGRNIAHNLSLLTTNIKLITLLGDDVFSKRIVESCNENNIDISESVILSGVSTSTYLFITDEQGDMLHAVSDMEIYTKLTPKFLESRVAGINLQQLCVCDTNIPLESLEYVLDNVTCPVFVDCVSTTKAGKLQGLLHKVHTLKPNKIEAELLSGVKIVNDKTLKEAAEKLLALGLHQVFITLGSEGVYAASEGYQKKIPCYPAKIINTSGAGDSFFAGIAYAFIKGFDIETQARYGLAASSVTVSDYATVSQNMHSNTLEKIMRKNKK